MLLHTLRRVVAWALGLVLVAGTAAALAVAVFPLVTGGSALAVLSGSMSPGLPVGAMAFVRTVDPATVEPGDVITFQRAPDAPELVTHRVLAVDDSSGVPVFTTQGDANASPDLDPVPASAVRGELWFGVSNLGRASALLHSPKGAGLLVVLVCGVIAAHPGPRPGTARPGRDDEDDDAPRAADGPREPDVARTVTLRAVDGHPRARRPLPPVPPPARTGAPAALLRS
ncbi:signal peptidase I [Blastococcus sp. TML/M2B]|uniref:signal peptidase I n=1 Tax=Blastococcus sp. TML/M2B TaxID=2798727 RepID=UPI00190D9CAE|nr:signal peptidase I [Blastococcus sp. TML/M2B]MBN1093139.1 signal peptidase I [Blastococcus sp. TML/M2B]